MLRNCPPQDVRRVIFEWPASLNETFERILSEISMATWRSAVYRVLECLCVAARPLRLEELAELLAPDFHRTEPRELQCDDWEYKVLSWCSSLITLVDNGHSRVVQLSHLSVKEFLTSDRLATYPRGIARFHITLKAAHRTLTQACLATLLRLDGSLSNNQVERNFPLAGYVGQHWMKHALLGKVSFWTGGMRQLFDPTKPYFSSWLRLYNIDDHWNQSGNAWVARGSPLYYASLCGLHDLAEHIIKHHPEQVNATGGRRHSPLAAALSKGHFHVADILHQHGASMNATDYDNQTLLQAASVEGQSDVTRWLLDYGADMNSQGDDLGAPIHLATANGHPEVIETLLEYGVDIDSADDDGRTPLHLASSSGKVEMVRLLLELGADPNAVDMNGWTPLSMTWITEVECLLLDYGASPGEGG